MKIRCLSTYPLHGPCSRWCFYTDSRLSTLLKQSILCSNKEIITTNQCSEDVRKRVVYFSAGGPGYQGDWASWCGGVQDVLGGKGQTWHQLVLEVAKASRLRTWEHFLLSATAEKCLQFKAWGVSCIWYLRMKPSDLHCLTRQGFVRENCSQMICVRLWKHFLNS